MTTPANARRRSFTVVVSDEDGDGVWVVTDSFGRCYGEGPYPVYALFDWLRTLDAHYRDLRCNESQLATGLAKELASLRKVLQP